MEVLELFLAKQEALKNFATKFFYYWWNQKGNNTEQGFNQWMDTKEGNECVKEIIAQFQQPKEVEQNEWISVETPPEDEENVLVLSNRMNGNQYDIYMGWVSLKQWYVLCDDGIIKDYNNNADHCTITHWQPLPLSPTKQKQ